MDGGRHAETRVDRRARARALGGFFAAGAMLSTTVVLLPGWDQMHEAGIVATVLAAGGGAAILVLFAQRLGAGWIHTLTGTGTVLIAACQVLARGGGPTAMYSMLYIWVILHSSLFFGRAVVAAHLATTTLAHALALAWLGDVSAVYPQLAMTLGTQVAAAVVVGSLAARQRELAETDSLTGLGNRRVADRALESALDRSRRGLVPTCVAVLDLDGFKALNDERGHAAGDAVLVEIAAVWRGLVRRTDALARTGGDEFLLVLSDCDLAEAERIVRRMVLEIPGDVSCSAGLARWDGQEAPMRLMERADAALYDAKSRGPLAIAP